MSKLYQGTAKFYARYRPAYPDTLIKLLHANQLLDPKGDLLDIGCGTGQLTYQLSPYFARVIAVDQDAEMLAEAQALQNSNIQWLQSTAEQLSNRLGSFKLITIGRAMHWLDQAIVLPWIYRHLQANGGLLIIGEATSFWENQGLWQQAAQSLVNRYLGLNRQVAKQAYLAQTGKKDYRFWLKQQGYTRIKQYLLKAERLWTIETILGFLYSTANCSTLLLGDKRRDFEKNLITTLLLLEPSGLFAEKTAFQATLAFK